MSNMLAISPIDGRYFQQIDKLSHYFSETALISYRLTIEIEYFIILGSKIPKISKGLNRSDRNTLRNTFQFALNNALAIKEIELTTNHDVKAIEYFLANKLEEMGKGDLVNFVHFGLTSQDICSLATACIMKDFNDNVYRGLLKSFVRLLSDLQRDYKDIPMLARTHGQPASPTYLGRQFSIVADRLRRKISFFDDVKFTAKFGGATGGLNAHYVAYPDIDWCDFMDNFVDRFGVERSCPTTQVDNNDVLIEYFDAIKNINNILIGFCQDMWTYISMGYFKLKVKPGEIGSSTMPHKINPINFENAEGNLGMANAILEHFITKFSRSRLQRDLSDSTVFRNLGVPFAHTLLAFKSLTKGLEQLEVDESRIAGDLDNNWSVVTEGIQTILRREGRTDAYEILKDFTRNNQVTFLTITQFICDLDVDKSIKDELFKITPFNYVGV